MILQHSLSNANAIRLFTPYPIFLCSVQGGNIHFKPVLKSHGHDRLSIKKNRRCNNLDMTKVANYGHQRNFWFNSFNRNKMIDLESPQVRVFKALCRLSRGVKSVTNSHGDRC